MNKILAALMVALMPVVAFAGGATYEVTPLQVKADIRPVVSVIDLTDEQMEMLVKARSEYTADAEYRVVVQTLLDSVTAKKI
ncbi:MAG TPA: hypothetical protein VNR18_08595 [Hyphomicrobiales bacterium]|nr:hypothetical protein [Hyphomicrobiales bacterium]